MRNIELSTLKMYRTVLIEAKGRVKVQRAGPVRTDLRKRLDDELLAFRVARKAASTSEAKAEPQSWLRAVRQAAGIPVNEVARRLGVNKGEVFRLEKAERSARIGMGSLRKAAEALGCELIYALAPREGSLEDLAEQQKKAWEAAREEARLETEKRKRSVEDQIDWRPAMRRHIRRELRKHGIRVM